MHDINVSNKSCPVINVQDDVLFYFIFFFGIKKIHENKKGFIF